MLIRVRLCCVLCACASPLLAQSGGAVRDPHPVLPGRLPGPVSVAPPADWQNWTPAKEQFRLYINFDGSNHDTIPKIDIFDDNGSWPFNMQFRFDTLYLHIGPAKCSPAERSAVDRLPQAFPIVIQAGTERAIYWFSYDNGSINLGPLQPAGFISQVPLYQLPDNVRFVQFTGSLHNAKTIKQVLRDLDGLAEPVQLAAGFYEDIWLLVKKATIRRWPVNETATGTFLVLQCTEESQDTVTQILRKYQSK